jgi:hypothetical protein
MAYATNTSRFSRHAEGHETLLARMPTVILPIESKRVIEGFASALECDAMFGEIRGSFGFILLEIVICHMYGLTVVLSRIKEETSATFCTSFLHKATPLNPPVSAAY